MWVCRGRAVTSIAQRSLYGLCLCCYGYRTCDLFFLQNVYTVFNCTSSDCQFTFFTITCKFQSSKSKDWNSLSSELQHMHVAPRAALHEWRPRPRCEAVGPVATTAVASHVSHRAAHRVEFVLENCTVWPQCNKTTTHSYRCVPRLVCVPATLGTLTGWPAAPACLSLVAAALGGRPALSRRECWGWA